MMRGWLCGLLLVCAVAIGAEGAWVTQGGERLPDTAARKSVEGFGGWLVVTPDPEWATHWKQPPRDIPRLPTAQYVGYGERLTILAFYRHPATDAEGRIDIRCRVRVTRPDGTVAQRTGERQCASRDPDGHLDALRISWAVIEYVGEAEDPPGQWTVDVVLTDAVRGVEIPLRADFVLTGGSVRRAPGCPLGPVPRATCPGTERPPATS